MVPLLCENNHKTMIREFHYFTVIFPLQLAEKIRLYRLVSPYIDLTDRITSANGTPASGRLNVPQNQEMKRGTGHQSGSSSLSCPPTTTKENAYALQSTR